MSLHALRSPQFSVTCRQNIYLNNVNSDQHKLRWWQTTTQCCGHIFADTNVSPFARARSICCGHKFCVRDTKNVSDFVRNILCPQQMFPRLRGMDTLLRPMSNKMCHCLQQMLRARANGETFVSATMFPQHCVLVCHHLNILRAPCNKLVRLQAEMFISKPSIAVYVELVRGTRLFKLIIKNNIARIYLDIKGMIQIGDDNC